MKILKYYQYSENSEILSDFINKLDENLLNESTEDSSFIDKILRGLSKDLKFNIGLVFTFGTGIRAMFPIVENLIKNGNFKIDPTPENIILLCLTSLSICYLESTNVSDKISKTEVKSLLEELKMRGIGNGIVKVFVKVLNSIGTFIKNIFKNTGYAVSGLFEMLGYTALMVPFMNAINFVVGKYDLTPESLVGNLLSVGLSIGAFSGKNIINIILKKLKDKLNLNISSSELEKPVSIKSYDAINDSDAS